GHCQHPAAARTHPGPAVRSDSACDPHLPSPRSDDGLRRVQPCRRNRRAEGRAETIRTSRRTAMNRWLITCFTAVGLVAPLALAPVGAEERRPVPVPAWTAFDGKQWGDLVLGETTRSAFDEKYTSSPTERGEVLQA